MRAALKLLGGEFAEPAFDQVEPGARGWGEVDDESRVGQQPFLDRWGLVGRGVVENQMYGEVVGDFVVDRDEELLELDRAVPRAQGADDLPVVMSKAA